MIIKNESLSVSEAVPYLKGEKEELANFLKQFVKLNEKDSKKLREELNSLKNDKLREEHIVKIIDILPENSDELNKICNDISLEENETNKILDAIKSSNKENGKRRICNCLRLFTERISFRKKK
jgi:DNA-directed RNA polymerase subunit F